MYSYKLHTESESSMSPIQFEVCNCTFSDFDSAWSLLLYIQCLWFSMKFLNVQLQTSSWIRVTECTVTNLILNQRHWMYSYKLHPESESLNVQLQTSCWIGVTECTVTNFKLNRGHWMYSYKLHPESVTECTVTVHSVTPIQQEVCNCTFSASDSVWSL
jgi:hypothetical protein